MQTNAGARAALITGATGLVGSRLVPELLGTGWEVHALSRSPSKLSDEIQNAGTAGPRLRAIRWDGENPPPEALEGAEAIVHLAGEPVFGGLPTAQKRERIRSSRVDSTRAIVAAVRALPASARPQTLVCASAVGYYGSRGEEKLDEGSPPGEGFLADVCRAWEDEAEAASELGLRVVRVRIGIVLSGEGGALAMMKIPFGFGLGGKLGSGDQWMPWIDHGDLVRLIVFALEQPIVGAVNACSPKPVRNADFTRALARTLARPAFIPVPAFAVRAALGELAGELLGSRCVVPAAATAAGFEFAHSDVEESLTRQLAK